MSGYGKMHRSVRKGFRKGLRRSIENAQIAALEAQAAAERKTLDQQTEAMREKLEGHLVKIHQVFLDGTVVAEAARNYKALPLTFRQRLRLIKRAFSR